MGMSTCQLHGLKCTQACKLFDQGFYRKHDVKHNCYKLNLITLYTIFKTYRNLLKLVCDYYNENKRIQTLT